MSGVVSSGLLAKALPVRSTGPRLCESTLLLSRSSCGVPRVGAGNVIVTALPSADVVMASVPRWLKLTTASTEPTAR